MRKSRLTESQILAILSEGETGLAVVEVCRKHDISSATYYQWKSKYAGMSANELKRVKELEAENARLKRVYAELALKNAAIKDRAVAKMVTPIATRAAVQIMVDQHHLSQVRAWQAVGLPRSALPTMDQAAKDAPVINAIAGMLKRRPRSGFWKCFGRLRGVPLYLRLGVLRTAIPPAA